MIFHHRLGHINFRALSNLATKHLLYGLPASLPSPTSNLGPPCLDCAQSKLREQPHPPTESISTAPLDRVHMDLWGPPLVRSRGGHFYFLVIIDDYSRYVSVHLLTSKLLVASSLTPPPLPLSRGTPCSMLPPSTIFILILTTSTPPPLSCGRVKSRPSALCAYGGALLIRDVFFHESHPFYPSSKASPSPPPPSLTWADFDSLPPPDTPSPPLPAPSTVSDPPPPTSPSSTTQSPPLLPSPSPPPLAPPLSSPPALTPDPASTPPSEPPPLKTYHRRPTPAPALDPALAPTPTSPTTTLPPAPPPSPIASRTRSHKAPKPLSFSVRVSLNLPPVGGDYSLMPSLLEDRYEELIDIDSAIHALCFLFPDIADSPTLNFSDNPSNPTPLTYAEADSGPHTAQCLGAIVAECEAFIHTGTFTDVSPPFAST
ncbi:unnamed protein product [Closterium sp. NIES-53]